QAEEDVEPLPLQPGACGQPEYEWVSRQELGKVISWQEDEFLRLPSDVIDGLLGDYGYQHLSPVPYGVRVFVYRYTTQDRGQVIEATAALAIPDVKDSDEVFSTVAWLHLTTGYTDQCAPSADLAGKGLAGAVASLGFISVAPDYIGMNGIGEPSEMFAPYLIAEPTALASWDAVRAAHSLLAGDLAGLVKHDKRVVPWGISQGGHAALAMNRYAPYYAPEYKIPGVAAVVPPADIAGEAKTGLKVGEDDQISERVAIMTVFLAQSSRWYTGSDDLSQLLTDEDPTFFASTLIDKIESDCNPEKALKGVTGLEQVFTESFMTIIEEDSIEDSDPYGCYVKENSLVTMSVERADDSPVLFVLAEHDQLVDSEVERQAFDALCALGQPIQYLECADSDHFQAPLWSIVMQRDWIRDRLDGKPIDDSLVCQRTAPQLCDAKPEGQ
ncbi:MAG TPA: alpha/beta fold hydrolase, partial [Myxococcota bacterium]|nr:alpha/beta fold hydrolase [Myxococcota bacterium]